jgi:calcineurin-like phosphoesterase family protein
MNNVILQNINAVVKKDDILYHLGDFCLGNKDIIKHFVDKIICKRNFIILGNHDRYKPTDYMNLGFEWATRFPIIFDGFIILSHESVFLNENCQPYVSVHGHNHNSTQLKESDWSLNISCENTFYSPITLNMIKKEFKK